jgi:hypothetical protein
MKGLPNAAALASVAKHENSWRDLFHAGICKVVETEPGQVGQYVALSYCWGACKLPFRTTSLNLERHRQGFRFARLPTTLQDAIMIARFLGYNYIWIDCVCIIQGDGDDWAREAARMTDIYSNAALCITVERAKRCDEGFLHARKREPWNHLRFEDDEGFFGLYFCHDEGMRRYRKYGIQRTQPLRDRGWAFQERLLSARRLNFASDITSWNCCQLWALEDGSSGNAEESFIEKVARNLRSETRRSLRHQLPDHSTWYQLVEQYTSLSLTEPTDKLPALSGIIAAIQQLTGDTCYAGLWKEHFIEGLLWRINSPTDHRTYKNPRRPNKWRAPSWSFAAVDGTVTYNLFLEDQYTTDLHVELQECVVTPLNWQNPLGVLKAGFARIKGPVTAVTGIENKKDGNNGIYDTICNIALSGNRLTPARISFDFMSDVPTYPSFGVNFDDEHEYLRHKLCDVLMINQNAGIAIVAVNAKEDQYVRIGVVARLGPYPTLCAADFPEPSSVILF